jgi:hypothetical protein
MPVVQPHDQRRGWLKNDNPAGRNFTSLPRCGAKNRQGMPCQCPAMSNGRCRLHGGLSTGPTTTAGMERMRRALTIHGWHSKQAKAERAACRLLIKQCWEVLAGLREAEPANIDF